jgi:hypothetical protein
MEQQLCYDANPCDFAYGSSIRKTIFIESAFLFSRFHHSTYELKVAILPFRPIPENDELSVPLSQYNLAKSIFYAFGMKIDITKIRIWERGRTGGQTWRTDRGGLPKVGEGKAANNVAVRYGSSWSAMESGVISWVWNRFAYRRS